MLRAVRPAISTPVSVATPSVRFADDNQSCTNNAMVAAKTPAVTKRFIPCNDATTHRPRLARSRGLIPATGELPGLGRALYVAIGQYDTPVIVGSTVIYAYLLALTVFLLEFIYALVDPRVKIGGGSKNA